MAGPLDREKYFPAFQHQYSPKKRKPPSRGSMDLIMGKDFRGDKRGACNRGCGECEEYCYSPSGPNLLCASCNCLPVKHQKIEDPLAGPVMNSYVCVAPCDTDQLMLMNEEHAEMNQPVSPPCASPESPLVIEVSDSSPSVYDTQKKWKDGVLHSNLCSSGQVNNDPASSLHREKKISAGTPKASHIHAADSSSASQSFFEITDRMSRAELYEFCVPSRLPSDTMRNIQDVNSMTSHDRQFILRWILWSMVNLDLLSDFDFTEVATRALTKYPLLQVHDYKGVKGLVSSLKEIRRNHTYYAKKKKTEGGLAEDSYTSQDKKQYEKWKASIVKEMKDSTPSLTTLKALLKSCRSYRQKEAKRHDYSTHVKYFPCLKLHDLLMWEFIQLERMACCKSDLEMRWVNALPRMCSYFSNKSRTISKSLSNDQATAEVLECLSSAAFFGPRKPTEKRDQSSYVLELFEDNALLQKTKAKTSHPPRLIAVGNVAKDNLQAFIYVDGTPVFSGSMVQCIVHIVALYYVFHIKPAAEANAAFSFIFGVVMQEGAQKDYSKYKSVLKALEFIAKGKSL